MLSKICFCLKTPLFRASSLFNGKQRKEKEFRTKAKIHEIAKAPPQYKSCFSIKNEVWVCIKFLSLMSNYK